VAVDVQGQVIGGVGIDDVLALIKGRKGVGEQCDTC
jgi:osmoprotectant transport system ATP-binding protein